MVVQAVESSDEDAALAAVELQQEAVDVCICMSIKMKDGVCPIVVVVVVVAVVVVVVVVVCERVRRAVCGPCRSGVRTSTG